MRRTRSTELGWGSRGLLSLLAAGSVAIAAAAPAAAATGHIKRAEQAIDLSEETEHVALRYVGRDPSAVDAELGSAEGDLERAIRYVEEGVAAGEIEIGEAAELILDLRDAIAEDKIAEDRSGRLLPVEQKRHIRSALAHKRRARRHAASILVGPTGTNVSHSDTPPPPPAPVQTGSNLAGTADPELGDITADLEVLNRIEREILEHLPPKPGPGKVALGAFWDPFLARAHASAAGATSTAPVSGQITSYTVKGYTISSNRPGPGGSGEVRLGIEEPQANGQVKVLSTSNPPNLLPHATGTYTFPIGPPNTAFTMSVQRGDVLSLDTPGGDYAVFAAVPGAELESSQGRGEEQNPGTLWTLSAHPNLELLMQVTIAPSISVTALEEAEKQLKDALALEHRAARAGGKRLVRALKKAGQPLKKATELVAAADREGALSAQSDASIGFYLGNASADVRDAGVSRFHVKAQTLAYGSAVETQEALSHVSTAKSLAKQVP